MGKSIPGLAIEGQADIDLNENENTFDRNVNFKYRGDAIIDPPPGNYKQAVETYKQFSKLAKTHQNVVAFTLAPIERYCDKGVNQILNDITEANVQQVTAIMVDFDEMEISLKSLKRQEFTQDYPKYMTLIDTLDQGFDSFKSDFKTKIY